VGSSDCPEACGGTLFDYKKKVFKSVGLKPLKSMAK
jgi:hypothetical protein